jgi:8-oxo-dGTP pyrophosphatase MutT (NUDIX family)
MNDALRAAATVVLLRDGAEGPEAFLVKRNERASFMPGAHVFPGGVVDASDLDLADERWCDGGGLQQSLAARVAGIRELFEEAAVLLARKDEVRGSGDAGDFLRETRFREWRAAVLARQVTFRHLVEREHLRLITRALVPFAHWVTPRPEPRRFDTLFFVARLPDGQAAAHDALETTEGVWLTPGRALAEAVRGAIGLPPPTWVTLREIERDPDVDSVLKRAAARQVRRREPIVIEADGQRISVMPGDPAHPEPYAEAEYRHIETRFVRTAGGWKAVGP